MAGFKVRVLTAGPHVVGDLGITLDSGGAAPITEDLTSLSPQDVARSADLLALVTSDDIFIVDARDDADATFMSKADSTEAIESHNDTHFGVSGGRFAAADDPTTTSFATDYVLQYDATADEWTPYPHEHLFAGQNLTIGEIIGGMGKDGTDTTFVFSAGDTCLVGNSLQDETYYDGDSDFLNGSFVGGAGFVGGDVGLTIVLSDTSTVTIDAVAAGAVTAFTVTTSGETVVTTGVALTQTGGTSGGAGFTLTPEQRNVTPGKIQWDVNDVFLRNTGDTLDSGTLTIASGAAVSFGAGSTITIDTAVTTATIITPAGGFTGASDLINKEYVDAVAGGLDWKESVRLATTPADGDILAASFGSGTYTPAGGPTGTGQFTLIDLSSGTGDTIDGLNFTGVSSTGLIIGDRVLIKNQTDAEQNGIYEISAGSVAASVILTRAADQDGSPSSEVSAGNATYVEDTTAIFASSVNSTTAWVVTGDGELTLNTDDINWVQFAGTNTIIAGIAMSNDGLTYDVDVDDAATATAVLADSILFHDANGAAAASGSQTRKTTFTSLFNELDVPNAITTNGLITRTAEDTYASRTITASAVAGDEGISLVNGNGVAGDPTIGLDIAGLTATSGVTGTDRVAVWDGTNNVYYTVTQISGAATASNSFETWARTGNGSGASLVAASATDTVTINGGIGIDLTFTPGSDTMSIAFTDSGMADTAILTTDAIPFFDASNGGEPEFRLVSSLITDLGLATLAFTTVSGDSGSAVADTATDTLNIVGTTVGGITTVASDAPETVTIGITGFDLATGGATLATTDFIIVNDSTDTASTLSLKYTFSDMITDLSLLTTTTGVTDAYQSITGGDGGTATAIGEDTITFNGTGIGVTATNGGAGADTVAFVLDISDLTDMPAAVVAADEIAIHDITDGTTYRQTWTDVITDLGLVSGISAATDEDLLGIDVTGTVIGLDILGLTNPAAELAATDEFPVHDKSEGTAGANRKMTGQNIADGTAAILGIDTLTFTDINGQSMLTVVDTTRSSKVLSVDSHPYQFSDNSLADGSWVEIGNATDADAGWIMPFDGIVVAATGFCENPGTGNTYEMDLFINGADNGSVGTLSGAGNDSFTNTTLDLNFVQGDRLRVQADQTVGSGDMGDTTIMIMVRWRDV